MFANLSLPIFKFVYQMCSFFFSRKFSTNDKKKLWAALSLLPPEDLIRALEIVAENNPSFQPAVQEVDLDLNAQVIIQMPCSGILSLIRTSLYLHDFSLFETLTNFCHVLSFVMQSELTLWRLKVFVQDVLRSRNPSGVGGENKENLNKKNKRIIANNNSNKNNSKRRREICSALARTSAKKTKISVP